LSEICLKYILSIENSHDDGWLTVKNLTASIDRFVAAKCDAFKPRAYAIGQTPYKPIQKPLPDFGRFKAQGRISKPGTDAPKSATNVTTTPRKQITCYGCGRLERVRSSRPSLKKPPSSVSHASSKRAAVIESSSNASIMPTAGGRLEDKPSASAPVSMKVDGATNTDTGQEINQVTVSLTMKLSMNVRREACPSHIKGLH